MSDNDQVKEFLEHFGVKGMKWGVRKASIPTTAKGKTEQAAKAQETFNKLAGKSSSNKRKQSKIDSDRFAAAIQFALARPTKDIYITRDSQEYIVEGRAFTQAAFSGKRITYDQIRLKKERSSEPMGRVEQRLKLAVRR